ncbi:LD-carboxypeptidase [Paraburkholderia sp. PGU19]|uniref:S66 peptidase family protein n=1 Tax=Paraburkholderia sp. PGU19 TaxID=2735434 RepID=UPI0015D9D893|nr:LD-carboxypeptidase [Paraburkholderia sp. PGU19]BCG00801.1 LD-carboxypeptidase [Paraburkholderia sp. PGU19]
MKLEGKTVAVVAPAGVPDMQHVEQSIALLESWGLRVQVGAHVRDRYRYHAGKHEDRAADLHRALTDPSVDIVWVARGGYGSIYTLHALPDAVPCAKTLVGFSDATALFGALHGTPNVRVIHGPTLNGLATKLDDASRASMLAELHEERAAPVPLQLLYGSDARRVEGHLAGGNITVLASLAGTQWQARCDGAIVLLEDVTELAYRIDRSVMQLREAGVFDGARAFVLGDFIRCPLPENADFTLHDMMVDLLKPYGVPIYAGFPIGHGSRNHAWTYGAPAALEGDQLVR